MPRRQAPGPNIILAMGDDMGSGDPGFNGNRVIKTPHLDELAKAGLRFERFYSGAPVCSPTRGTLIYRADQDKIGQWSNAKDWLSWEFEIHQPGRFEVEVSCGQTEDGSAYEIAVGEQSIKSVVSASGDYKRPKAQIAGSLDLPKSGRYTLSLKPVSKKGAVVMTLWRVDLIPGKAS